jgi:hypothetical protein
MDALSANWVWLDDAPDENVFARARRTFTLDSIPDAATVRITCSGLYRLWVNGRPAGRGPALSPPERKQLDVLDVAGLLQEGENVLAVRLVHFGYATACVVDSPPGFLCQLDLAGCPIVTDDNWRISLDPCYELEAARRNGNYGPVEIYDARKEDGWLSASFDDAAWLPASVRPAPDGSHGPNVPPWTEIVAREIPQCREEPVRPVAVTRIAEVQNQEWNVWMMGRRVDLPTYLLCDVPVEPNHASIDGAENLLDPAAGPAIITQPSPLDQDEVDQYCATLILDFGREIAAFGWLDVEGNEGAIVDVAYGERLIAGRVQSIVQNTGYADRLILREGRQRHEVYDWKGYRYVQLTFRELTRPLKLHAVGATFTGYPYEANGSFHASHALFDRIWEVGAYTQQLCTHDRLMDTPWREQQEWLGDGRVQLLIIQNAFGAPPIQRKFLRDFAVSQPDDGMVPCVAFHPAYYITDYALWWVQGIEDVLIADGDVEFAAGFLPQVDRLFDWFDQHRNAAGLLESVPGWTFIDWANVGKDGVCAPLNAIFHIALEAGARVAEAGQDTARAERWRAEAGCIAEAWHALFWDPERRLYADSALDGRRTDRFSQHTQAIGVIAGLCQDDPRALMKRTVETPGLVLTEPYFSFYLLEALAQVGLAEQALEFIGRRWGGMIGQGATSFWEEWQVTGTFREGRWTARPRSHCHAWSAAPTAWLSRHILGVRTERAGGPVLLAPQPASLEWARGAVPSRFGPVEIAWEAHHGRLSVRATVPPGTPVESRQPDAFRDHCEFEIEERAT